MRLDGQDGDGERKSKRNQTDNVNALSHMNEGGIQTTECCKIEGEGGCIGEKGNESKTFKKRFKKGFEEKGPERLTMRHRKRNERAAPRAIRGSESRGGASSAGKLSTA